MSRSVETWSTADVHQWLMTEVKVHLNCAESFTKEEVSGDHLLDFEKEDILELGIKHGPAVKISHYLESLKAGSKHQCEFPAYVEMWTKEQVSQWLLQHVKVYGKYGERVLEEDVSGDCLVCFRKKDFLDLGVKSGPAVKILAELRKLKTKPEPILQATSQTRTDQGEAPKPAPTEPNVVQTKTCKQPESRQESHPKMDKVMGSQSKRAQLPSGKEDTQQSTQQSTRKKQSVGITAAPETCQITVEIQKTLANLQQEDFKRFRFYLKESGPKPALWSKLEGKDSMDIAQLLSDHYGKEEALQVTIQTLKDIGQTTLACQLESTSQLEPPHLSREVRQKEANQGHKLKALLTCGGNSLDNYDRFVVVVNKSSPEQVPYLQFLSKLKLFCVLDFDPNSVATDGLCHSYRKSRVANLHTPTQFQGQIEAVTEKLNLYKQTSWVFCNGRNDLNSDSNKELDYKNWMKRSCKDVEQLVSFICNPDVCLHGRWLIIFFLLSPVDTNKDPVYVTYMSFIKHTEEENIISICESMSTYLKWKELIQENLELDIENLSVTGLTLSEINGTIMGLGPLNRTSGRLLPSSGSSAVVLTQKDEDLLTALDVLCLNQCENIYDDSSSEFDDWRINVEEEFYRGGKVQWWNFYFCDKDQEKPFIKRDKYKNVKTMITSQKDSTDTCVLLNLFHDPGCGGTTLAMHVMWDLRQEFRCAVLKDKKLPKTEVASQVRHLMTLESEKPSPVLLLVDDTKETENLYDLVNCIRQAVEDFSVNVGDAQNSKVIILNCVRSHNPKDQYRQHDQTQKQYITAKLTQQEQKDFEKKLKDLKETHKTPENFYSFMIMKSNFDQKYTKDLAHNTLENFDFSSKKGRLFALLALLNTYLAKSEIALSLCEDFFQMKVMRWQEESVLDRMKPCSNLLIIDKVDEWGGYKGIRILHHAIASACLDELERSYSLKVSDIVMEMLHCDLFFSAGVVKHKLMLSIQRMLIERQRKKDGDERERFSPLIDKIHNQEGRQTVQAIFEKASSRYETSASIPQALARYLYINVRDFPEALLWAEKAKNIKENPYTFDTIGQVHKSSLKSNMDREKQETSHNPEDLHKNIEIAKNGMKAFQRAQELADFADEPREETPDDDSEDFPRKSYSVYGYVCMLEIAFLVFEILSRLPFFDKRNPLNKMCLQSFLKGTIPITSVYKEDSAINNRYVKIIEEHEQFLVKLKSKVKELFDFLNCYFTYIKGNSEFDMMNHRTVCEHFQTYVDLFCTSTEEMKKERENKSTLNLKMDIEDRKRFLERTQADTFSGILQYLDKPADEIERITECYTFLHNATVTHRQHTQIKINYILSNIVLYHLKPNSKYAKRHKNLSAILQEVLQDVGLQHPFPDPYYLALLLYWPSPSEENTEICKYVTAVRKSSHRHLSKLFQKRSTIAHFYLGKDNGLKKLVSKPSLDQSFLPKMRRDALAQLWWNGNIFKEEAIIRQLQRVSGSIEQGEVYASCGSQKIPVRPARISGIRSGFSSERVSFYLGFAINGPLAYDIKYEN